MIKEPDVDIYMMLEKIKNKTSSILHAGYKIEPYDGVELASDLISIVETQQKVIERLSQRLDESLSNQRNTGSE